MRRVRILAVALVAIGCVHARPPAPVLRVGTSADYAPFSAARGDAVEGLDIDVARRLARDLGMRLELVRFRWPELAGDLAAGRFDLAMGGITMRPERAMIGRFTRPVAETHAFVLARPGVARSVGELARQGLRLAVNAGGHLERVAARLFPRATLVRTDDNRALAELVRSGAADALVTDDVEADTLGLDDAVRVGPLTRDRKAYLGRDPALVARVDAWLRAREADGALAALRARWLGAARAAARSAFDSDLDALIALVDLRLACMPAVAAAKAAARIPISVPEQEARVLAAVREQARARGLDADRADAFFRAQLEAARAIQRRALEVPSPPAERLDLDRDIRPALAALSAAIVDRAADVVRDPDGLARLDPDAVATRLDGDLVPAIHRAAIARGLVALRPADGGANAVYRNHVCKRAATPLEAGPQGP